MRDGITLAIGTLTRLPVPPPRRVDRPVAGLAMSLAPLVGLGLAVLAGVPLAALAWILDARQQALAATLLAALAVAWLAWLTRGLHLDGLADVADALGSGKPPEAALAIARRSDTGPFATVALLLALLLQVLSLGVAIAAGVGVPALVIALVASRLGLTWACTRRWPPARPEGLGATVAQSTSLAVAAASTLAIAIVAILGTWALAGSPAGPVLTIAGITAALAATWIVCRIARRRLGGITGDVLGAVVEWAATASLVTMAVLAAGLQ